MELFESAKNNTYEPLASRMRPRDIEEFAGQDHILAEGRLLRRAIQLDQLSSLIFYGPPGTGKTTLARVIANTTKSVFTSLNAVLAGVKEIREIIPQAKDRRAFHDQKTILFVDEVHRWNKSQQDALLPWVENGTVIFIGATTQNPYFEVNPALVSRSRIFQLLPLTGNDLEKIMDSALSDPIRGYGNFTVTLDAAARNHLIKIADGDARSLLNALELAVETTPEKFPPSPGDKIHITLETAEESIQKKALLYDRDGDYHYDTISAFIKSMRGSDPDATMYWLAKMVAGGEDPKFIFRRMLIFASEDIGMADPNALIFLESAASTFERIGLPEGRFQLAHAALYCATAPKSNSVLGFFDALDTVEQEQKEDIPAHLKDGSRDKEGFGHGKGYLYPHSFQDHWVAQQYLPGALKGKIFYHPGMLAFEKHLAEEVLRRREAQIDAALPDTGPEILSFAAFDKDRDKWLKRASGFSTEQSADIRSKIFKAITPARHDRILVCNAGKGLLVWEALRKTPEGAVTALVREIENIEILEHYGKQLDSVQKPFVLKTDDRSVSKTLLENAKAPTQFEFIIGRNILGSTKLPEETIRTICSFLIPSGMLSCAEPVVRESTLLSGIVASSWKEGSDILKKAEDYLIDSNTQSQFSLTQQSISDMIIQAGITISASYLHVYTQPQILLPRIVDRWFDDQTDLVNYGAALKNILENNKSNTIIDKIKNIIKNTEVEWQTAVFFVSGVKDEAK